VNAPQRQLADLDSVCFMADRDPTDVGLQIQVGKIL